MSDAKMKKPHNNSESSNSTKLLNQTINNSSSRDYFKNFSLENFSAQQDASLQTSIDSREENEVRNTVKEISESIDCLRKEIASISSMSKLTHQRRTNYYDADYQNKSHLCTPEFVFLENKISTELHKQVEANNIDRVLQLLLDHSTDINYRDSDGVTPLQVATRNQDERFHLEYYFQIFKFKYQTFDLR